MLEKPRGKSTGIRVFLLLNAYTSGMILAITDSERGVTLLPLWLSQLITKFFSLWKDTFRKRPNLQFSCVILAKLQFQISTYLPAATP